MKRVLVLSPERLFPSHHGGSIRTTSLIRGLARRFEVTLVGPDGSDGFRALVSGDPDLGRVRFISAVEHSAAASRMPMARLRRVLARRRMARVAAQWASLPQGWTFCPLWLWEPVLDAVMDQGRPDVVIIEHSRHLETLGRIRRRFPGVRCVVNSQNVESDLVDRMLSGHADVALRGALVGRIRALEARIPSFADRLWVCSEEDAKRYRAVGVRGIPIDVIPNGVDLDDVPFPPEPGGPGREIVFCGTMCYAPNIEGVLWFHRLIWPLVTAQIPDLRWTIVGHSPPAEIVALAGDPRIRVTGSVPDVRPHLRGATLSVCPLLTGGGTRLKILEALAIGSPTVSTNVGAEGLGLESDVHCVLVDDPGGFAEAVVRLIRDPAARHRLRDSGRRFVEERYQWSAIAERAAASLLSIGA